MCHVLLKLDINEYNLEFKKSEQLRNGSLQEIYAKKKVFANAANFLVGQK